MKIFITGIAGFIGSALARRLCREGHTVTGLDNLSWGFIEDIPVGVEWVKGSLSSLYTESKFTNSLLNDVDAVIHCAANLEVTSSLESPTSDMHANVAGTIAVLDTMKYFGIKNIINFSSACVYGRGDPLGAPSHENSASLVRPQWPYGASKLAAEVYCNLYAQTHGFKVVNLRPGIVCGPGEWYGRALTIFLRRALERKPIVLFQSPEHHGADLDATVKRDFVHISDIVSQVVACLRLFQQDEFEPLTLNAGSGTRTSIRTAANLVGRMLDVSVVSEDVLEGQTSSLVEGRVRIPHEMQSMFLDMDRSRKVLGHIPVALDLEAIIADEVAWLREGWLKRWQRSEMKV